MLWIICKMNNEILINCGDFALYYVILDSEKLDKRLIFYSSDFSNHVWWLGVCIMYLQL